MRKHCNNFIPTLFTLLTDERELQEIRQLKDEIHIIKEAALNELQSMRTATLNDINATMEEARQVLNKAKETAENVTRQGESVVPCGRGCEVVNYVNELELLRHD